MPRGAAAVVVVGAAVVVVACVVVVVACAVDVVDDNEVVLADTTEVLVELAGLTSAVVEGTWLLSEACAVISFAEQPIPATKAMMITVAAIQADARECPCNTPTPFDTALYRISRAPCWLGFV